MSYIKDKVETGLKSTEKSIKNIAGQLTGQAGSDAAREAAGVQVEAGEEASELFNPFRQFGAQGLAQSSFLTDPQQQFRFLESNPLFQSSLDNANRQTSQLAAARGRLSSGDTLQRLSQNTLLAASPLIQQQKQSILDKIGFGERAVGSQANLRTGQGAAIASGVVGGQNAMAQGTQNMLDIFSRFAGGV